MYLVNLNLTIKVWIKGPWESLCNVHVKVHVLTDEEFHVTFTIQWGCTLTDEGFM